MVYISLLFKRNKFIEIEGIVKNKARMNIIKHKGGIMMGFRSTFIVFLSILLIGCSVHKNNEEQDSPIAIQTNNQTPSKIVLLSSTH